MSDTLYLAHLPLSPAGLNRWGGQRGWAKGTFDEGRALHHLLSEMFGAGALRPFRLMVGQGTRHGNLYAYTLQDDAALSEIANLASLPDHLSVIDPTNLRTKPMPIFRAGQRLGFDLRARPVRRLAAPMGKKFAKGDEVDVFLHEALRRHGDDSKGMQTAGRDRDSAYRDWLAERLAPVADLDRQATVLTRMRRQRVVRDRRVLDGPDATFHGTLTVTDPEKFRKVLTHGVGRHGAYGYGMLLLRPPAQRSEV